MKKILLFLFLMFLTFPFISQEMKSIELNAAGATFPAPLYVKMFDEFNKITGMKVNYQGIGSGGGIKQLTEKTIDFGATDAPMTTDEIKKAGSDVIHIPIALGSVVITYNLPGNPKLKMTPEIISDIFLGKITKWNDIKIVKENEGIKLPALTISVIHRSDSSGTTFVFTEYLTKVSPEWKEKVGTDKSPKWPIGLGGKGNPGVAGLVQQVPGSIGYVELIFAVQNKMPYADVKNKKGKFIEPTLESTSAAANGVIPDDTKASLTDTDAIDGYPISTMTWLLVYPEQNYNNREIGKASAMVKLFWWLIHDAQTINAKLDYAPLPKNVVLKAEKLIKLITFNGKQILK